MAKRRSITIGLDRTVGFTCFAWRKMRYDVVTEKIYIEAAPGLSPHRATQDIDIEGLSLIQIIDGN